MATKTLGIVLYHNFLNSRGKFDDDLQNEWDVVVPSTKMLEIALRLDRIHTFGNISMGQLLEKMGWVIEFATTEG